MKIKPTAPWYVSAPISNEVTISPMYKKATFADAVFAVTKKDPEFTKWVEEQVRKQIPWHWVCTQCGCSYHPNTPPQGLECTRCSNKVLRSYIR